MILPSLTMTAPNGPPHPFSTDSMASRVASWANCFLYSLLSISVVLMSLYFSVCCGFVLEGNGVGFVVFSKKGNRRIRGVLVHVTRISKRLQPITRKARRQGVCLSNARFSAHPAPRQEPPLQRHRRDARRPPRSTLLQKRGMEIAES